MSRKRGNTTNHESQTMDCATVRQMKRLERQRKRVLSETGQEDFDVPEKKRVIKIEPKTEMQARYLMALEKFEQVLVFGPAGVGKTFISTAFAAKQYQEGKISKIILARPTEPTGRSIGFLPGTEAEKLTPWLAEPIAVLKKFLGTAAFEIAQKNGDIEMQPLEMIRGRSFSNAFIHITECQNASVDLMKSIVTRTGEGSKLVLDGDIKQTDLRGESGLAWALRTIDASDELTSLTGVIEFDVDDVVRSELCKAWVKAIY
jgi:phosphate starvation-inducible PhoH-like protein